MSDLVVVLCRLNSVNLETSAICQLFNEYGLSLEHLGKDLFNIFKLNNRELSSKLYHQALLYDIPEMIELSSSELDIDEVIESLEELILEIEHLLDYIDLDNARLVNLQLSGLDTLILEYLK